MPNQIMECHRTTWGVRPEILPLLAAVMTGRLGPRSEEAREVLSRAALTDRTQRLTGGVAVLSLTGLITPYPSFLTFLFGDGGGLQLFRSEFREALAAEDVGAILIDVDSPGGSTELITETAAEIRDARGTKPIVAIANTLAASAAYWIAAQADEVIITPSGEAGSIGVFAVHDDWSGFNERVGVKPTYISAGRFKTEANPDEPLSDEAREAIQQTVDEYYALFVADVAAGRGASESAVRDGYGEGRVVTAKQAVELGMADRIATFEATVAQLIGTPDSSAAQAAAALRAGRGDKPEPVAQAENVKADKEPPAEKTSPTPVGGGDPEQGARIADVLFT